MDKLSRERLKRQAQEQKSTQPSPADRADTSLPAASDPLPTTVRYRCGHDRPLEKLTGKDCPSCREKAAHEKRLAQRAKREAKIKERAGHETYTDKGRLPDGAAYQKTYNAANKRWTVILMIPGLIPFQAEGSGSLKTEFVVDNLYRDWLAQQTPEADRESTAAKLAPANPDTR